MTGAGDNADVRLYPVTDLAGYFGGSWILERRIADEAGREIGTFTGTARFTA